MRTAEPRPRFHTPKTCSSNTLKTKNNTHKIQFITEDTYFPLNASFPWPVVAWTVNCDTLRNSSRRFATAERRTYQEEKLGIYALTNSLIRQQNTNTALIIHKNPEQSCWYNDLYVSQENLSKSNNELKPLLENPASGFLVVWAGLWHGAAFDWIKVSDIVYRLEQSHVNHALVFWIKCLFVWRFIHCINGLLVRVV